MSSTIIKTDKAPQAIGPYVQARKVGPMLYTSGQIGLVPGKETMVGDDIESQTNQVLANLAAIVAAGGGSLTDIVKTTIFVTDLGHFATVNKLYAAFFGDHKPARSTVEVSALPKGALIEIECIAHIP